MEGQGTLDLELERLDALSLEELERSLDARAIELGLRDLEPEVWPDPFDHTDWLGLEHLEAGEVVRKYGAPPEGPPLSENVHHKRELLGWMPELPLEEVKVHCTPRVDLSPGGLLPQPSLGDL